MHSKVHNGGLKRNASISADSQPTELIRTDEPTSIISVFSVLSFSTLYMAAAPISLAIYIYIDIYNTYY